MIIIRISGGLGNQLFQYALGRNLSLQRNVPLKFDLSFFEHAERKYALNVFNIVGSIATSEDFEKIGIPPTHTESLLGKLRRKLFRLRESYKPLSQRKYILEPYFHFCPDILAVGTDAYLSGIWQSEKYFLTNKDAIEKDISLKEPLSVRAKMMVEAISKAPVSVSLHVRRGDYVHHPKLHNACSPLYYEEAIKRMHTENPTCHFFVFSDDIEWVRANITIPHEITYVSSPEIKDYEEMLLMSKCTHNILANSSFSWWGAWLNTNPKKIVVAPKNWFNLPHLDTKDLIPSTWIRL